MSRDVEDDDSRRGGRNRSRPRGPVSPILRFVVVLGTGLGLAGCDRGAARVPRRPALSVERAMGGDARGHARAVDVPTLRFPRDHGEHPEYRTEWWYVTGNLVARGGERDDQRFGFQWTLFRNAVAPPDAEPFGKGGSSFRTRQVWMGHFAITDIEAGEHRSVERFGRGALQMCGARVEPTVRVWLEDWELAARSPGVLFPANLRAAADGLGLDLWLANAKPFVLQGEQGLSRKGAEPGNASYYYSYPRLSASGTLRLDGEEVTVRGNAWLDREWGTSALGEGVEGWDWFALQFEGRNQEELMLYRLRRADGSMDRFSRGVLVRADGSTVALGPADYSVEALRTWANADGHEYSVDWRIRVPAQGIDIRVEAAVDDQEVDGVVRYWEGAVLVRGTHSGRGYLETTK